MSINQAKFLCSSQKLSQCPPAVIDGQNVVEVAFIGRSNVGKSSLVNMLCQIDTLAKVSSTPGKTRLINHFVVDDKWLLVDLPGYGYARTSKSQRSEFSQLINDYITKREELYCLFVLIDIRLEPQKIDLHFMEMLAGNGIPFAIIFTKGDKLSTAARQRAVDAYNKILVQQWEELPPQFITSSQTKLGRDELVAYIESFLESFQQ